MSEGLVLLVCTANLVRSPVAEAAFNSWRHGQRGTPFEFGSRGLMATPGGSVPNELIQEIRPYFLDLHAHRSQPITRDDLVASVLVLGMTESHRESLQAMLPSATPRIFTLKEFARLVETAPKLSEFDGDIRAYVGAVHRERPRQSPPKGPEDVVDPFGATSRKRQACIAEIVGLVGRVTARLC